MVRYRVSKIFLGLEFSLLWDCKLIIYETEATTHASRELVKDIMMEMHTSGKELNGDDSDETP